MPKVVGIDLGTTNSVIAVMIGGEPTVIPNSEGSRLTPSVVGFTKTGERLVGQMARRQAILNPENTVYSIKRFMGRRLSEEESERKIVSYKVEESILEIGEGVYEVKSTNGDTHLGGDDFDERIFNWLADEFKKQQGIDLRQDRQALQRLREAAERAKIELSTVVQTSINLPFITADASGPKHLDMVLTRAKFDELTADLVERCIGPFKQALADAKLTEKDLNEVILVGGATRMPSVQELVRRLTGKEPNKEVHPDEVVAVGAAIQAGVLAGEVREVVLLDVTPLSLGIETLGGVNTVLIQRNTTIPTRKTETFSTAEDAQTAVDVHVLQGERPMARDNRTLATFLLDGLPPAPRAMPQIEVTFATDANGILNVSAKDKATGREQSIKITGTGTLDKKEVDHLVKEAEAHAADDQKQREGAEIKNRGDSLAYQTERMLKEVGDKVSADDRRSVETALAALREALKSADGDRIKRASEALQQASYKLGEEMYKRSTAGAGAGAGAAGGQPGDGGKSGGDEVIDAEFKPSDKP